MLHSALAITCTSISFKRRNRKWKYNSDMLNFQTILVAIRVTEFKFMSQHFACKFGTVKVIVEIDETVEISRTKLQSTKKEDIFIYYFQQDFNIIFIIQYDVIL
jgi:hypothetical protein